MARVVSRQARPCGATDVVTVERLGGGDRARTRSEHSEDALANPIPMAAWGLIVAAGLVIGSVPALLGLVIVMPVLGHTTWHLYRRVVAPS
jgi:hypothetical protein